MPTLLEQYPGSEFHFDPELSDEDLLAQLIIYEGWTLRYLATSSTALLLVAPDGLDEDVPSRSAIILKGRAAALWLANYA
ncbi:MAG TPA: hypothetical protein PKD09_25320 [Aggregatilinea sp.]|uniref:hypothetical protein n=1 Tax=Aggregatilinea sp. TaxID=2806333 RepID=UPI002D1DB622|nr:hypothetical protein [Aggregatilinea sp.]HML25000.1 hypothetical protein [Aggregatilinea sp.]